MMNIGCPERVIGLVQMTPLLIPHDGFPGTYWRRPEAYLNPEVRGAISSFPWINVESGLTVLRSDLSNGRRSAYNSQLLALAGGDNTDLIPHVLKKPRERKGNQELVRYDKYPWCH